MLSSNKQLLDIEKIFEMILSKLKCFLIVLFLDLEVSKDLEWKDPSIKKKKTKKKNSNLKKESKSSLDQRKK